MSILIAGHRMLLIVIVAMGGIVPLVASQGASASNRGAIERGRATYEQNCATCHGNRGKGDAPGTAAMKPRPTDLTTLTKQYGAFPAERVEATLKGTDSMKAHTPGPSTWPYPDCHRNARLWFPSQATPARRIHASRGRCGRQCRPTP